MLGYGGQTPSRFELLSMVRKHSKLLDKNSLDLEVASYVEIDSRFWHDSMNVYFIRGRESRGRQEDDMLFFVSKMGLHGKGHSDNVEGNSPFFVRRWAPKLDELVGENSLMVDWRRSFYLNLIAHTSFTVTVAICSDSTFKDIYMDVISVIENFVEDEKSANATMLSSTKDIGSCRFSPLESHFAVAADGNRFSIGDKSLFDEQCNCLRERLNSTISSMVLHDAPFLEEENLGCPPYSCKYKERTLGKEISSWKEKLDTEVKAFKEKYENMKKEISINNQFLEDAKDRFGSLEREFHILKEEKDALLSKASNSSQVLALFPNQKEKAIQDLKVETQRSKDLEEMIKNFSTSLSHRQRSLVSLHSDFQSIVENLKAQNLVSLSRVRGSSS